jgi:hypothetical protein
MRALVWFLAGAALGPFMLMGSLVALDWHDARRRGWRWP